MTATVTGLLSMMMRVVCLVPSWTETLLECGVNVVGRTRFCVHPAGAVRDIPIVGGTKDLRAAELVALNPDLVVLDREENPREFVEQLPCAHVATHVGDLASLAAELRSLAQVLRHPALAEWADRAAALDAAPALAFPPRALPGMLEELEPFDPAREITYLIWRGPWMAAGPGTFIHAVLGKLGFRTAKLPAGKYPVLEESALDGRYFLFSSEPFPFARKTAELRAAGLAGAVVDGEAFSWFGVRAIRFLESILGAPNR